MKEQTAMKLVKIAEEFPFIQKAAYEAQYACERIMEALEKVIETNAKTEGLLLMIEELTHATNDLLIKKGIISQEELSKGIEEYKQEKEFFYFAQKGYEDVEGPVIERDAVIVKYLMATDAMGERIPYEVVPTWTVYKWDGFEKEIIGMEIGSPKTFTLTMPETHPTHPNQSIRFDVEVLKIKRKVVVKNEQGTEIGFKEPSKEG